MNDTPRTDAIRAQFRGQETELCRALIAHSNTIERELNEAVGALKRSDKLLTEVIRHVGLPSVIDAGSALGVTHLGLAQHLQDCRAILQKHQSEKGGAR